MIDIQLPEDFVPPNMICGYNTAKQLEANGFDMSRITVVGGWYNKKTKRVEKRWFNLDWRTPTEIKTENLIKRIKSIKNKWKIIWK